MSQKRPQKRSRSSAADKSGHSSPSNDYFQPKRSKLEEHTEHEEASVRRSSRAPKPKLFDDEYIDTFRSSFDDNEVRGKKENAPSPTNEPDRQVYSNLSSVHESDSCGRRKSSRAPKPKVFDEDYVDSPKSKSDAKTAGKEIISKNEKESVVADLSERQQKHKSKDERKEKRKSKDNIDQNGPLSLTINKQTTPKQHQKGKKLTGGSERLDCYPESQFQFQESAFNLEQQHPAYGVNIDLNESPKIRHSSRTPKPKKTFSLIEAANTEGISDEEVPINIFSEESITPSTSKSSKKHGHRSSLLESSFDVQLPLGSEQGKKKGKGKAEMSTAEKLKKKTKQSKTEGGDLVSPKAPVMDMESKKKEGKKDGKEKSKKNSTKNTKEAVTNNSKKSNLPSSDGGSSIVSQEKTQLTKKSKKKVGEQAYTILEEVPSSPLAEKSHSKHSSSDYSKKAQSKHTKTKHDRPHSETKDQDKHIILKLHLPHSEGSSHTHSHKKHKHRHHSSESKTESLSSDGKTKKRKLPLGGSSSSASEETHKKVSIKFKGLSSSKPDVQVDVESTFSPPRPPVEKVIKEPEAKKKKTKKHSRDASSPLIPSGQEHVKVIIKKSKKEVKVLESGKEKELSAKTQVKETKAKPKETKAVSKETSQPKPKSSPKKKSKAGGTPEKEKKKIVTGYLLFCKSKRSQIAEANPGMDFPQVSQKVGETWNKLPEDEKQKWRDKANNIKAKLNINVKNVKKKEEKKHEAVQSGHDVVDMAAHLKLLGESLTLIGVSLMAQRGTEVHGSLSVLLDSILCAICPLTFLTSHIPGIPGVAKEKQVRILDDLAYTMPGLG